MSSSRVGANSDGERIDYHGKSLSQASRISHELRAIVLHGLTSYESHLLKGQTIFLLQLYRRQDHKIVGKSLRCLGELNAS